jgi:hypothetical protein
MTPPARISSHRCADEADFATAILTSEPVIVSLVRLVHTTSV